MTSKISDWTLWNDMEFGSVVVAEIPELEGAFRYLGWAGCLHPWIRLVFLYSEASLG